jgi:hypothetical protein
MTKKEVELAIRKAHIMNRALFVLKIVKEKLPLTEESLIEYISLAHVALSIIKDQIKESYKKYDIKLVAPDKDLEPVFIEAENLANSSFPHRALGFVAAVFPEYIGVRSILSRLIDQSKSEDIKFSHQLFKNMLENQNDE